MLKIPIVKKAIKNLIQRKIVLDQNFSFGLENIEISHKIKRYDKLLE
jgi:hypothetical protein